MDNASRFHPHDTKAMACRSSRRKRCSRAIHSPPAVRAPFFSGRRVGRGIFLNPFKPLSLLVPALAACTAPIAPPYADLDKPVPGIFLDPGRGVPPQDFVPRPVSSRGLMLTKNSEGFESRPYNDPAGFCTVAYGHLIAKARCNGVVDRPFLPSVTEPRGESLLIQDMKLAQYAVFEVAKIELSDGQYAALVDFTFNVGAGKMKKSTVLSLINEKQFSRVPAEWRKWVLADGKKLPGLVARREKEIELFFEGMKGIPRGAPSEDEGLIDIRRGE